jgi:NADH:ubiquinone oxidoreductase subunit 11 or 4L (chain K)
MIPLGHSLLISAALFVIGLGIVAVRRELLFVLMGLEVMFNAAGLAAIASGQRWHAADGQVLTIFLITATASELVVALVLIFLAYRQSGAVRVEDITRLRDGNKS